MAVLCKMQSWSIATFKKSLLLFIVFWEFYTANYCIESISKHTDMKKQSDQGLHCLSFCQHLLDADVQLLG